MSEQDQPSRGEPAAEPATGRRLRWGSLLRLLGPLLLALLLWRMPDRVRVLSLLGSAELLPLLGAVALNAVVIHLKVARWRVMLRAQGVRYGWGRSYAAFLGALYLGMVTPGHVGDALRIQYLRHDVGVRYADGLATVVMDRLCDLYVLAAVAALGLARFSAALDRTLALATWGAVALAVLAPLALLVPGVGERASALLRRRLRGGAGGTPAAFQQFVSALRAQVGRALLWTLPLTVAAFAVNYLQGWLLGRALHVELSYVDVACLLGIANLLALLPISISGVGVREALFLVVFPLLGHPGSSGVSFGLAVFGSVYLVNIVVGAISWQLAPPPAAGAPHAARV